MPRYIDADTFYDKIERLYSVSKWTVRTVYRQVLDLICEEVMVDVQEVKHGKWKKDDYGSYVKICSFCGRKPLATPSGEPRYSYFCPHCGANMNVMDGDTND